MIHIRALMAGSLCMLVFFSAVLLVATYPWVGFALAIVGLAYGIGRCVNER
jgi:hypothetical protein